MGNKTKNAKDLSERENGMSTCLAQMEIFSLAGGCSGTKYLPLSSFDVRIVNVIWFLSVTGSEGVKVAIFSSVEVMWKKSFLSKNWCILVIEGGKVKVNE